MIPALVHNGMVEGICPPERADTMRTAYVGGAFRKQGSHRQGELHGSSEGQEANDAGYDSFFAIDAIGLSDHGDAGAGNQPEWRRQTSREREEGRKARETGIAPGIHLLQFPP